VAPAIAESDSIVERIGDSSSLGSRVPIVSKMGASASLGRSGKENVMMNNFFNNQRAAPSYDPNSIINIMIQRSMPRPAAVQSPVKINRSPSKNN
jgi:hypothetical protein